MLTFRHLPFLPIDLPPRQVRETVFAINSVYKACAIAEAIRSDRRFWRETKADGSLVTAADFVIQLFLTRRLAQVFPGDVLVSEEDGQTLRSLSHSASRNVADAVRRFTPKVDPRFFLDWIHAGRHPPTSRYWGSDPIDVTSQFVRGGQYSTSLFLVEDGVVTIGVMGCPNLKLHCSPEKNRGELLVAVAGYGAWCCGLKEDDQFHRLHVSERDRLQDAVWARPLRDVSARQRSSYTVGDHELVTSCQKTFGSRTDDFIRESNPVRYARVAAGEADFLMNFRLSHLASGFYVHDHAPGMLLVTEAGGKGTDLWNRPANFRAPPTMRGNYGLFVSNGTPLHDEGLELFSQVARQVFSSKQLTALRAI